MLNLLAEPLGLPGTHSDQRDAGPGIAGISSIVKHTIYIALNMQCCVSSKLPLCNGASGLVRAAQHLSHTSTPTGIVRLICFEKPHE